MPSDTDYDSLPSPPPPRRARTGLSSRGTGHTRLYGKRGASRAPPSAAAPPSQQPTRATPAESTRKRSLGTGNSSADDGELSSPSPKGKKTVKRLKSATGPHTKSDTKGKRRADKGSEADIENGSEEGDDGMLNPRTRSSPVQRVSDASDPSVKRTMSSVQGSRAAGPTTEAVPNEGGVSGSQKPSPAPSSDKTRLRSKRLTGTALQDKSNSTVRNGQSRVPPISVRPTRTRTMPEGPPGAPRSRSPQKGSYASRLQVFRDEPNSPVDTRATGLARRPSLPMSELPPRQGRPPRRNVLQHASGQPASVPTASTAAQEAALLLRSPAAQRRGSVSVGQAARSLLSPAPEAASAEPLPRPVPWALSTPASPLLDTHSSSPADGATSLPVFRFTTTEFGDSPSLQLHQAGPCGTASPRVFREFGAGEAEGMDSSIMLETWDNSATGRASAAFTECAGVTDQIDDDVTMRQVEQMDSAPVNPASGDYQDLAEESTIRDELPPEREKSTNEDYSTKEDTPTTEMHARPSSSPAKLGKADIDERQAAESPPAPARDAATLIAVREAVETGRTAASEGHPEPGDDLRASHDPPTNTGRPRSRAKPLHYTSTFLPARHPRWPIDEPRPVGPPSSEDELAYYLRTSGTFSSEDDLPANGTAPSDESAKEDWLVEREVGRALKPTSKQREKRIAAYNEASSSFARLRLGEGSGGRRKDWKREILPLDQVRLPRQMREAIEAKAVQLGEALGGALEEEKDPQGEAEG